MRGPRETDHRNAHRNPHYDEDAIAHPAWRWRQEGGYTALRWSPTGRVRMCCKWCGGTLAYRKNRLTCLKTPAHPVDQARYQR